MTALDADATNRGWRYSESVIVADGKSKAVMFAFETGTYPAADNAFG